MIPDSSTQWGIQFNRLLRFFYGWYRIATRYRQILHPHVPQNVFSTPKMCLKTLLFFCGARMRPAQGRQSERRLGGVLSVPMPGVPGALHMRPVGLLRARAENERFFFLLTFPYFFTFFFCGFRSNFLQSPPECCLPWSVTRHPSVSLSCSPSAESRIKPFRDLNGGVQYDLGRSNLKLGGVQTTPGLTPVAPPTPRRLSPFWPWGCLHACKQLPVLNQSAESSCFHWHVSIGAATVNVNEAD